MDAHIDHAAFYKKQISLTEWFGHMHHRDAEAMRVEDNDKRERLRQLNDITGLPFDKPRQFSAQAVASQTPEFKTYLAEHGNELCAIRLIPLEPTLPKLRMRGKTVTEAVAWFADQNINPLQYRVDFIPHPPAANYSTIFVVNAHGIFGEIIAGAHHQLTQGYPDADGPITFSYDFKTWHLNPKNPAALAHLKDLIQWLHIDDSLKRDQITRQLDAVFTHNYLQGYFETVASDAFGIWFIDYNRILGKMYESFTGHAPSQSSASLVSGQTGSSGRAKGRVRIVELPAGVTLEPGEILVCRMTSPDYLPLMQQAAAIVTDLGGILSHAAIVARELGKPCLTATRTATTVLQPDQFVEVDADAGVVRAI